MPEIAYYLDEFSDEVTPCGTSLKDWAGWLSEPDEDWNRPEAAKDGDTFTAHVYEFHQVSAVQENGAWVLKPNAPEGTEFMAIRFGDGKGWWADDVASDLDDLRELLDGDIGIHPDGAYFIACAIPKPRVTLTYSGGTLKLTQ